MSRKPQSPYQSAEGRWAGVGPYYAMFPTAFADRVIRRYTVEGSTVLDPFAGRGTSTYSAAVLGRHGIGIELNPVGWVYAKTKLGPASEVTVKERIREIGGVTSRFKKAAEDLPKFFEHCFTDDVRRFLVVARAELNWRQSSVDRTVMALLLINLHGKREASLSNQLRQTKSMSPDYAVAWWKKRGLTPPDVHPVEFLLKRVEWRYAKGTPDINPSWMYLGDSVCRLPELIRRRKDIGLSRASLLLTSPPYYATTNYHYDQWLRLWLLGGPPNARRTGGRFRDKFEHKERYRELLRKVFAESAKLLTKNAVVYVRTSRQAVTLETTLKVLRAVFPKKAIRQTRRPFKGPTQTRLFGDHSIKEGEVDLILS